MNASQPKKKTPPKTPGDMTGAFIASGIFHFLLFLLALFGLPFIAKDPPLIITSVSVEMAVLDEITQTNKVSKPKKREKKPEIKKPEPPKKPEPEVKTEIPPDLKKPQAPEPLPLPKKEKPKEKPKPKKEKPKPKPKPKEEPKEDKNDFESLLKNLNPEIEEEKPNQPEESQIAKIGERLTVSELDGIRGQIEPCWNFPIGAKNAEELTVQLRIEINRDMSVKRASVINKGGYNNPALKAAEESALRAVRNPRCSQLKLPPEKYETWKVIILNFDPSSVL